MSKAWPRLCLGKKPLAEPGRGLPSRAQCGLALQLSASRCELAFCKHQSVYAPPSRPAPQSACRSLASNRTTCLLAVRAACGADGGEDNERRLLSGRLAAVVENGVALTKAARNLHFFTAWYR